VQRNSGAIVAASVAIAALIVGCGEVSGTAQPVSNELFDPCAVVPDEAIRAAGADPATKDMRDGPDTEHWDYCTWAGDWFYLGVQSTTRTIAEVRANPTYTDMTDVPLKGRDDAIAFRVGNVTGTPSNCAIAFGWERGTVVILIDTKLSMVAPEDSCRTALKSSDALTTALPR
jgi:hypothetical protein